MKNSKKNEINPYKNLELYDSLGLSSISKVLNSEFSSNKQLIEMTNDDEKSIIIKNSFIAETNLLTRDKISNTLLDKDVINKGEQLLSMEKQGSTDTVTTKIIVTLEPEDITQVSPNLTQGCNFTYFDKCVFDSICSLLVVGNKAISLGMIARNMMGKKNQYHPSEKMLKEIDETVNKLERIKICIDLTEEIYYFTQLQGKNLGESVMQSRFLEFRRVKTVLNGTETHVLLFSAEPILLQYAKLRSQISNINGELLDTPTQKSKNLLTVQTFLIQKINMLKLNKSLPQSILYESIYNLFANEDLTERGRKGLHSRIRQAVTDILDYWVCKEFIHHYEIESKNRARFYKINIFFE